MQHCRAAVSNVAACLHTVSPSCCSAAVPLNIGQVAEEILTRSRPPFTVLALGIWFIFKIYRRSMSSVQRPVSTLPRNVSNT